MVDRPGRRERERVDAFMDALRSCVSHDPVRDDENLGERGADSQSRTLSHEAVRDLSQSPEAASAQNPTVPPDRAEDAVRELVGELAEDIDSAITVGVATPFSGRDLRRFYDDLLRSQPPNEVLADVRRRWDAQVLGDVLPLLFADKEGGE